MHILIFSFKKYLGPRNLVHMRRFLAELKYEVNNLIVEVCQWNFKYCHIIFKEVDLKNINFQNFRLIFLKMGKWGIQHSQKTSCGKYVRLKNVNSLQICIVSRLKLFDDWLMGCDKTKNVNYVISRLMSMFKFEVHNI